MDSSYVQGLVQTEKVAWNKDDLLGHTAYLRMIAIDQIHSRLGCEKKNS